MRSVPVALQAHLDSGVTSVTELIRIDPVTPGYASFGITNLDRDVIYDDGDGEITYLAAVGMDPSNMQSTSDMGVDNSTSNHLMPGAVPEFDIPVSDADLAAGVLDFAWYTRYLVNFEDLSMGHVVLDHGQCGQMKILQGMTFVNEMTSLAKLLKQNLVEKDSLNCRADFGSQYPGTPDADITQRFPCTKAYTWVDFTVTSVSLETSRTFTASALAGATGFYTPGMVKWTSGANNGRQSEVEDFTTGGLVDLLIETMFPVQIGDTGQIRRDCTKTVEDTNGCKDHWGDVGPNEWKLHYRGEPLIPVSDADSINMPGAS